MPRRYRYGPERLQAIREAMPDVPDRGAMLRDVAGAAMEAWHAAGDRGQHTREAVIEDLNRLLAAYERMSGGARLAFDEQYPDFRMAMMGAMMEAKKFKPARRGPPTKEVELRFAMACCEVWKRHVGESPSARYSREPHAPFYKFVKATIPPEVNVGELTGVVKKALEHHHAGTEPKAPKDKPHKLRVTIDTIGNVTPKVT